MQVQGFGGTSFRHATSFLWPDSRSAWSYWSCKLFTLSIFEFLIFLGSFTIWTQNNPLRPVFYLDLDFIWTPSGPKNNPLRHVFYQDLE